MSTLHSILVSDNNDNHKLLSFTFGSLLPFYISKFLYFLYGYNFTLTSLSANSLTGFLLDNAEAQKAPRNQRLNP